MRELLFRGKNILTGEWHYGGVLQCENGVWLYAPDDVCGAPSDEYEEYEVIPETVGQFTGMFDRNGNKIFEGDILLANVRDKPMEYNGSFLRAYTHKETYWSVEHKNFFSYNGFMVYGIDRRWNRPLTHSRIYNGKAIVVGNIYDNKDLMKKEEKK